MIVGLALAWTFILVGCWLGWQLLRQNGRMLLRLDELEKRLDVFEFGEDEVTAGLPVGSEAAAFELPDLAGETRTLAQYRGQSVLLIFFNPACGFCRDLMPKLAALFSHSHRGNKAEALGSKSESESTTSPDRLLTSAVTSEPPLTLIITTGDAQANRTLFDGHKLNCPILLQQDLEVAGAYKANGTPSAYLIGADGKIASELAMGAEALLELANKRCSSRGNEALTEKSERPNPKSEIDQSLVISAATGNGDDRGARFSNHSLARSKIKRDGLKAGTTAPDFRLPRLDGHGDLALSDLRGSRVLLVFSSPGCGPCNTLAPQLEQFHRDHPELEVVMISKGEPKENLAKVKDHGLTFPVVLQQQWEISRRYAMFATPIAYLMDERGIIAHDVAVGPDAILRLMFAQNGHAAAFNPSAVVST